MPIDRRPTVLVVDDEPQVLVALEDALSSQYSVLKSISGENALRLAVQHKNVCVVVSDQRMPQMTGDQLFASLRQRVDASRILLTGYADMDAVIRAVNDGQIFAYIEKPWDPEALRMLVEKAAERFRLRRQLRINEERLRLVVEATGAALFDWNVDTGVVHYAREFGVLLGGAELTPYISSLLRRIHPDDLDRVSTGLDMQRDNRSPLSSLDCRIRTEADEYRWYSLSSLGVRNPSGDYARVVGAIQALPASRVS